MDVRRFLLLPFAGISLAAGGATCSLVSEGFEEGLVGWTSASNMEADSAVAQAGTRSARISVADPGHDAVYLTRKIPVEEGAAYEASCFVRTADVIPATGGKTSVGACLIVEWCDKNGKWMLAGEYSRSVWGTADWQKVACRHLKAPLGAGFAQVFLALRAKGCAWFDTFEFCRRKSAVVRLSPKDGEEVRTNCPRFTWRLHPGVKRYTLQLSRRIDFPAGATYEYEAGGLESFQLEKPLEPGTWYWRVVSLGVPDDTCWSFVQPVPKDRDTLAPILLTRACRVTRTDAVFHVLVRSLEVPLSVSIGTWTGALAETRGNRHAYAFKPPAEGWPEGLTEATLVATDPIGNRAEESFWLLCAEKPSNAVRVGKDGRFHERGRSIFPIGIYEVSPRYLSEVREAGFDVVHQYRWESSQDDRACRDYLDACWAANGLRAFIGFDRGVRSGNGLVNGNRACVAHRVGMLADHPGLFCWYLFDEPESYGQFVNADILTEMANLIRTLDPYHPVVLSTWHPTMIDYRKTWDTHWTQAYGNPAEVLRQLDEHRGYLHHESPITLLVNCNDMEQSLARRRGEEPNPITPFARDYDYLKACAFLGVTEKCNGLWWWWFARETKEYVTAAQVPSAWADLRRVIGDIAAVRPYLAENGEVESGRAGTKGEVSYWRKRLRTGVVLIAVNTSEAEVSVNLEVPQGGRQNLRLRRYEVQVLK